MISIDRVYKAVLFFLNSDMRGNVKPDELRLAINTSVEDIVESYFSELNRSLNRKNRGLDSSGLESSTEKIRERIQYFLKEADLTYTNPIFNLPTDIKYLDIITYNDIEIELCKNNREFKSIVNLADASPTNTYPLGVIIGNTLKVLPIAIIDNVSISYIRKHAIANWTFNIISGKEVYNPSANDFQDIDLHPSEEYNVIIKTCGAFGINVKEGDIVNTFNGMQQQEFNKDNAV